MDARTLIVMQEVVRDHAQISRMVQHVARGGFWTKEVLEAFSATSGKQPNLIYISSFPDGRDYIHDGHHRVLSTILGGRHHLRPDEYVVGNWTYDDYLNVKWDLKYVTPHDPRKEVRHGEFFAFKTRVLEIEANEGRAAAEAFIAQSFEEYAHKRTVSTVAQWARMYQFIKDTKDILTSANDAYQIPATSPLLSDDRVFMNLYRKKYSPQRAASCIYHAL